MNFKVKQSFIYIKEGFENFVSILKINVILITQILRLYTIIFVLKIYGKSTKRGKTKGGFKMVIYDQFENHQCE
jgi:hypothetical protein